MKQIEEFPNYFITEDGKVFNKKGKELKRQENIDGYWVVNLYRGGKHYHRRCSRMLGLTYLKDSYEEGFVINHKDFNRKNDTLDNLEWVSCLDNTLHSVNAKPIEWSQNAVKSYLTEAEVHKICQMMEDGVRNKEIIAQTRATKDSVFKIRCKDSWRCISDNYDLKPSYRGVSPTTVKWACYRLKEGLSYKEILELSTSKHLTINILKRIKNKKSWIEISKDILG